MDFVTIVTLLALGELIYFGMMVGAARGKYDIKAPATGGHDIFERHYRVHYNTLENLMIFLPAMWLFGYYIDYLWAAAVGLVFVAGRAWYGYSYVRDPASRGIGMLMTVLPCWILMIGGFAGALWHLVAG